MKRRRTRPDRIVRTGTLLILGLVAAGPLSLALLPTDALGCDAGTGDLMAAALNSLDRDIHGCCLRPAHEGLAQFVAFIVPQELSSACASTPCFAGAAPPRWPADSLAGTSAAGHQLLL